MLKTFKKYVKLIIKVAILGGILWALFMMSADIIHDIHNYGWDEILDWDLEDTTAVIVFYITCIYTFIGIWNKTFMLRNDEKEKP